MDPDQYIEQRVNDQIDFYDTKSQSSQRSYKRLSVSQIVCSAFIPFLSGFSDKIAYAEWLIALLGVAMTCSTAFLALHKHQERWINYRTTCETLKHLKHLFLTGSTPYKGEQAFDKFVSDIEATIAKENTDWGQFITKKSQDNATR